MTNPKHNITFVGIVQFDEEFGIPINLGAGILSRSIYHLSKNLKIVTICNRNISDQLEYMSFFENFKENMTISTLSKNTN
jgi:hypothetical protein